LHQSGAVWNKGGADRRFGILNEAIVRKAVHERGMTGGVSKNENNLFRPNE
jgi:hypothetical protein